MGAFGKFFVKQVQCSLFPLFILALAAITAYVPTGIPRYDLLLILCLAFQVFLVCSGMETKRELLLICLFHLAGLVLEVYKVRHGSWQYPDFAYTKFYGVPLFSGFMYAGVASYMVQAWRRLELRFIGFPSWWAASLVGVAIYVNFFSGRLVGDQRQWVVLVALAVFWRTWVTFTLEQNGKRYRMPMIVAFILIGFFVWVAEHLCTFFRIWEYPHQVMGWEPVTLSKLGSWCLLVIVSFLMVARWQGEGRTRAATA